MHKIKERLCYSPTDLAEFMLSPFASWMERFTLECPSQAPQRNQTSELTTTLSQKGDEQEERLIRHFQQGLDGVTLEVVIIQGKSIQEEQQHTLQAMQAGKDVLVQARLDLDNFGGYSDFLVKIPGKSLLGDYHYEVWDSKLATIAKPECILQVCGYCEMLASIQGRMPEQMTLVLGDKQQRIATHQALAYYRALKAAFVRQQENWTQEQPCPTHFTSWGQWSDYAQKVLIEKDHLSQVATMTKNQIKHLQQCGVDSLAALAATNLERVKGIHPEKLAHLKAQAKIQHKTKESQRQNPNAPPCFEIRTTQTDTGLWLLPAHCASDVFFDIEGYPLDDGGLEYLWGATYFDETRPSQSRYFKEFWGHTMAEEKQAFQDFIGWVYSRWQADPSMHIYHYANYEITACKRLMGRYGVCEYEIDQLLRNGVFVDLYEIVKKGILLGEPRYSIKNIEHLYREKRNSQVSNGADSVAVYERWRSLYEKGQEGACYRTSAILNEIRAYNIDDCNSTQELVQWLREQQSLHTIVCNATPAPHEPQETQVLTDRQILRDQLLAQAISERNENPAQACVTENLAWMLEFHRREAKPIFWRLFERQASSHADLLDDLDCLAYGKRTHRPPFKPSPRARNLAFEYEFLPQECKGATKQYYLLGCERGQTKVTFVADESDISVGRVSIQSKEPPPECISLIPDEYINPNPIPDALYDSVKQYALGSLKGTQPAILDFLHRAQPRVKHLTAGQPLAPSTDSKKRLAQIISAVKNLDNSYLVIQGPPGAGKSFTGKHIIAALLQQGAKVGIASNSHKAINHLLLNTAKLVDQQKRVSARFVCTNDTDSDLGQYGVSCVKNSGLLACIQPSCVIGTTAWGFAREELTQTLDYLFVDEAGQVSVANLIAMSRAARNLVLMGDQMQLGQPLQGSHPAQSGDSVLDYLLKDSPTIADHMGIFLSTTYRMHSLINRFISDHIYEGKLLAHPANDARTIDVGHSSNDPGSLQQEAGIVFVPVNHTGNTQASTEEVSTIVSLTKSLIGRTFHADEGSRPLSLHDILFVAPYNHQVRCLRDALGEDAKIGSVDKFQGQEAPIVILSMCASDPSDTPRGLEFLLDRQRLNVAVSRAQALAVIVGSPALGLASIQRAEQLPLANFMSALIQEGSPR